ncbi:hypothetical protein [Sphingomonas sp. KR3-1]|uniref:hypothetical protein n=1 Tax=Sphingomonas sp. KR3-1 TaxID=3156611 RepID=UPI0032B52A70
MQNLIVELDAADLTVVNGGMRLDDIPPTEHARDLGDNRAWYVRVTDALGLTYGYW